MTFGNPAASAGVELVMGKNKERLPDVSTIK